MPTDPLTESRRRALFAAIVESQDHGLSVPASRVAAAARFDVKLEDVLEAEREGMQQQWPPL
jgi:hypothetical protein